MKPKASGRFRQQLMIPPFTFHLFSDVPLYCMYILCCTIPFGTSVSPEHALDPLVIFRLNRLREMVNDPRYLHHYTGTPLTPLAIRKSRRHLFPFAAMAAAIRRSHQLLRSSPLLLAATRVSSTSSFATAIRIFCRLLNNWLLML